MHRTTIHSHALHCTALHYTTIHYTALHYTTLLYTKLHYTTLHCTTLRYTTLHYTALHYITLYFTIHYCTPPNTLHFMNCTALHCTRLHLTVLQYTKPVIESGPNLSLTTVFSPLATPFLGPACDFKYTITVLLGSANNLVHHVLNCFLLLPRHSVEAGPLEGLLATVCKKCAAKLPTNPTNYLSVINCAF